MYEIVDTGKSNASLFVEDDAVDRRCLGKGQEVLETGVRLVVTSSRCWLPSSLFVDAVVHATRAG